MNTKLEAGITEHLDNDNIGSSGKTIVVTRQGFDGGIEVDAFTGIVLSPENNPEWAQGLTNALLGERHIFYSSRLGGLYTDEMKSPETLAYEDLSWVHVTNLSEPLLVQEEQRDETGQVTQMAQYEYVELNEISADHEFRMGVIADRTGLAESLDLTEGTIADAVTQEIARDDERSEADLAAMEQAKNTGFSKVANEG